MVQVPMVQRQAFMASKHIQVMVWPLVAHHMSILHLPRQVALEALHCMAVIVP